MDTQKATMPAVENKKAIESHEKAAQQFQEAAKFHLEYVKFHKSGEMTKAKVA